MGEDTGGVGEGVQRAIKGPHHHVHVAVAVDVGKAGAAVALNIQPVQGVGRPGHFGEGSGRVDQGAQCPGRGPHHRVDVAVAVNVDKDRRTERDVAHPVEGVGSAGHFDKAARSVDVGVQRAVD